MPDPVDYAHVRPFGKGAGVAAVGDDCPLWIVAHLHHLRKVAQFEHIVSVCKLDVVAALRGVACNDDAAVSWGNERRTYGASIVTSDVAASAMVYRIFDAVLLRDLVPEGKCKRMDHRLFLQNER